MCLCEYEIDFFSDGDNSGSTLSDSDSRTLESLSVQLQEAELMQFVLIYLSCYLVAQSETKVSNQRYRGVTTSRPKRPRPLQRERTNHKPCAAATRHRNFHSSGHKSAGSARKGVALSGSRG